MSLSLLPDDNVNDIRFGEEHDNNVSEFDLEKDQEEEE